MAQLNKSITPPQLERRKVLTAIIDEAQCIGCSLCIAACPVDAIVGARKYLHTVLLDECIGCKLCVPICPVDCISMAPLAEKTAAPIYTQSISSCDAAPAQTSSGAYKIVCEQRVEPVTKSQLERQRVYRAARAAKARQRYLARQIRLRKQQQICLPEYSSRAERKTKIKAEIAAALTRVEGKRNS